MTTSTAHPDLVYPIPNNVGEVNDHDVNLLTGCTNLRIPLVTLAGLNIAYSLAALYDSRSAALNPVDNALGGYGWKLLDYPKIVLDGTQGYLLDGITAWPLAPISGGSYAAGGPYYLWQIRFENGVWTVVAEEARQFTLGNLSGGDYSFWHLSEIKDLSWGDTLTFSYDGAVLSRIDNTLGEALIFEGAPLQSVKYYRGGSDGELGSHVRTQTLAYDESTGVRQLSTVIPFRVLPLGGTAAESAGYAFSYHAPSDEDYTYALAETIDPLGSRRLYEYYLGEKIRQRTKVILDQHPVICVKTRHFPREGEDDGGEVCAGLWYDFSSWVYDDSGLLLQFNVVKQYPGGVQATASYDTPTNPYGHTTSYFFNGLAADDLPSFDRFDPDNPADPTGLELRGQRYADFTLGAVLTIDSGNLINDPLVEIGSDPVVLTINPLANVLRLEYSITAATTAESDVIFRLYDPAGNEVGSVAKVAENNGTVTGTAVFPLSIQVASIVMNSWWNGAYVNSLSLIRAAAEIALEVPTSPSANLVDGQNLPQNLIETIEFPQPVWVAGASYTMQAGSDEGSSVFYDLFDPSGNKVASLHETPWNRADASGSQTFGAPILVSSINLYSWWNNAYAISLVLDLVIGSATDNLMHQEEMVDTPQTIVLDVPVERVVAVEYAIKAGSDKISDAYYELLNSNGEKLLTVRADPENHATVRGSEPLSIPVEVAAIRYYSWWNYAIAESLVLITTGEVEVPLPTSGLAITDDRLCERQASTQRFIQSATLPSVSPAWAQLVKVVTEVDGVDETAEITWNPALGLPIGTLTSQARPNEEDPQGELVVVQAQITYAFEQYPSLASINLLTAVAQTVEHRAGVPGGELLLTRAETVQWRQEKEGGPWSAWRSYALNDPEGDPASGFQDPPPASWVLVEEVRSRSKAGMPAVSVDGNGLVRREIYDEMHGAWSVASFSNAGALADEAMYLGFEEYEAASGWTLENGEVQSVLVHTGKAAYAGDAIVASGTPFVGLAGVAYVVSAWVFLNENATCTIGFHNADGWNGEPVVIPFEAASPGWVYAQAICDDPSGYVPEIQVSSGAMDDISVYPVNASYHATIYDWKPKHVTARLSENGVVARAYRDLVESTRFATIMEQPQKLFWNASSRLNSLYWTGDAVHDPSNPNGAVALTTPMGGGVEDFQTVATPNFPTANLTNLAIVDGALMATSEAGPETPGLATFAGSLAAAEFALAVELEQHASTGELGLWLTAGSDVIRCTLSLDDPMLRLYSVGGGTLAQVSLNEAPGDMRFLVNILGSTVTLYANGRLAFKYEFGTPTNPFAPLGLYTTIPTSAFRNFAWIAGPMFGSQTIDASARPLQTTVATGTGQVGVTAQLYGGPLSLLGAVTRSTTQDGPVAFDPDFAKFDADAMTVSGGIVNGWPESYATQPFASSSIADRDPLLRDRSSGSGGAFTAGSSASEQYDYSDGPSPYFGFDRGELMLRTAFDPTGLVRQTYTNRQGVVFGSTSVAPVTGATLLTGYEYDPSMRLVLQHFPNAYTGGRLNPDQFNRRTIYDFAGRITSIQAGDTGMTRARYARSGLLRLSQDPRGAGASSPWCSYTKYDARGRVTESGLWTGSIDGPTQADLDDPMWPVTGTTWQRRFTYDVDSSGAANTIGRLVAASTPDSQETYAYDPAGNMTGITTAAGSGGVSLVYAYDLLGRVVAISGNDYDVAYIYDSVGRITHVGTSANPSFYATYGYGNGFLIERLNDSRITRTYVTNAAGWTESIFGDFFQETLYYQTRHNGEAGYDNGQIASIAHELRWPGAPSGYVYEYYYDAFGRLTTAANAENPQWSVGGGDSPLACDANGNLLGMTLGTDTTPYQYSAGLNQIESVGQGVFAYDAAGAVLSVSGGGPSFTYDPFTGQPATTTVEGGTTAYTYDARGRRLIVAGTDETVLYIHGAHSTPLMEIALDGSVTSYVYGPIGLVAVVTDQPWFILRGHRGSTRVVVDSSNQVVSYFSYLPFGGLIPPASSPGSAVPVRYRFCGQEYESLSGLYWMGNRLYDPALARYYAPDPMAQFPSPYAYASNPISFKDPSGDWFFYDDLAAIVIGASIGAITALASGRNVWAGAAAGAIAGEVALYVGTAVGLGMAAAGLEGVSAGGILAAFAGGAVSGAVEGAVQGSVQAAIENKWFGGHYDVAAEAGQGALAGALMGGVLGGGARGFLRVRRSLYSPPDAVLAFGQDASRISKIEQTANPTNPGLTRSNADVLDRMNASERQTLALEGHGSADRLEGMTAKQAAARIQQAGIPIRRIMLRSCNNGTWKFAGRLAEELRVPVYGSRTPVDAAKAYFETGNYRRFLPAGLERAIYRMLGYFPI